MGYMQIHPPPPPKKWKKACFTRNNMVYVRLNFCSYHFSLTWILDDLVDEINTANKEFLKMVSIIFINNTRVLILSIHFCQKFLMNFNQKQI